MPLFLQWADKVVLASDSDIKIESFSAKSEFPDGIRFEIVASSRNPVKEIAVNFKIGQQPSGVYEYLEFGDGKEVRGSLFWRTNTSAKYIPPGTIIEYYFTIVDQSDYTLNSEINYLVYSRVYL